MRATKADMRRGWLRDAARRARVPRPFPVEAPAFDHVYPDGFSSHRAYEEMLQHRAATGRPGALLGRLRIHAHCELTAAAAARLSAQRGWT
jgi:hypothetical protein